MMATPGDNTEVVRMLRDFKNAIYKSGTPLKLSTPGFTRAYGESTYSVRTFNTSDIAAKLDFTNLDETSRYNMSSSSLISSLARTPESSVQGNQNEMKRKLASAEVELQASRAALKEKETVISMMEPANKKACLSLEQKLDQSKRQNEADQEKIIHLKTQLKYAQNETSFAKNRVLECEKEKRLECDKLQMKLLALRQECSDMKLELSETKSEKAEAVRRLNNEIGRLELKLRTADEESNISKDVIQSLKKQVQELTEKASLSVSLQEELHESQLLIKSLENKVAAYEDSTLLAQSMQSELKQLPELRKENRILKEELNKYKENNVSLFQEKMWAFQEKLAQAEKKNIALAKLQVENDALKSKIAEWDALYDEDNQGDIGSRSPASFSRKLSTYQKRELLLTSKLTKLTSHCEALEKQNKALEATVEKLKKSYDQAKQSVNAYEPLVKRQQRRIFLLTKERDNCRKLIDSYVSETTMSGAALNSSHIKNLEDTISEYKKSLEKADQEIENLGEQVKVLSESKQTEEKSTHAFKELQDEKMQLLSTVKELQEAKAALEIKLAEAVEEKPLRNEKIIHLKNNPLDLAIHKRVTDFKSMQDENDRLRKRVKVLEEEGASACDITAKVQEKLETEGSDTLLQSLKDQLAAIERQNKLIIETARSKSREFREAVYSLTGYKFDVPTSGRYKLSHVYAESCNDFLLFEIDSQGVHLLESDYSSQLTGLIETYLQTYDSVPAFLACVTMDLFKQQTCMLSQRSITIS